jgi:pimeloyl-ACP methyl ester carboxylesterase
MPFIGEQGWPSDEIKPKPDLGSKLPPRSSVHLYHGGTDEIVPAKHAALNAEAIPQAAVRILADRDHQLNNDMSEVAADISTLE